MTRPDDGAESKQPAKSEIARSENTSLQEQDEFLDEALEESFPASDPIAPDHASPKPLSK